MNNSENGSSGKKYRYRFDILLILSAAILLITFCAYMINTRLEDTLYRKRGVEVVTHDYTYEDSSADMSSEQPYEQ